VALCSIDAIFTSNILNMKDQKNQKIDFAALTYLCSPTPFPDLFYRSLLFHLPLSRFILLQLTIPSTPFPVLFYRSLLFHLPPFPFPPRGKGLGRFPHSGIGKGVACIWGKVGKGVACNKNALIVTSKVIKLSSINNLKFHLFTVN
jgi:hypothetical protein